MRFVRDASASSLGIGLAAVSLILHRTVLQSQFLVNDDSAMMLAADGSLWGRPTPDLVFINPTLGGIIALLGRVIPGVPWYLVVLDSVMFVTLASVVGMWRHRLPEDSNHEWLLLGVFMISVQAWIWTNVSFTVNAILLAGVGAMLIAHRHDDPGPDSFLRSVLGGFMIGVAFWLRWAGAVGALVLIVPYLAATLRSRLRWKSLLPGVTVALLLVGVGAGTTWYRYQDAPSWQDYFEYNSVRTKIHDTARRFHMGDDNVLESAGWTQNDAQLLTSWYFPDREVFSRESLQAAVEASSGRTSLGEAVSHTWRNHYRKLVVAAAAAIVIVAVVLGQGRRRIALVGLTGWMLSVSLALAMTRKLPGRVALAFIFLIVVVALTQERSPTRTRRSLVLPMVAIAVALGLLTAVDLLGAQSRIADHHAKFEAVATGMSEVTSDGDLVVSWAGAYRGSWVDPRSSGDSIPTDLLPLGWQTFSPPWLALAATHGVSDVTLSIATDPTVYLAVDRRAVADDKSFERFASDHLGLEGRLRPVARVGSEAEVGLADIEVQVSVDESRQLVVETGLDGSETSRTLRDTLGSGWLLSEQRWPQDIIGWVDTRTIGPAVDHSQWDLNSPKSILPPLSPGRGDVWMAILYDGRISDLELAVPDPDVPGRWWFDGRVRGGEPGLWSVYLLDGEFAYRVDELSITG